VLKNESGPNYVAFDPDGTIFCVASGSITNDIKMFNLASLSKVNGGDYETHFKRDLLRISRYQLKMKRREH
jgi:hypothetical protein